MIGRPLVVGLTLLALAASGLAGDGSRLRIVTANGPVDEPHEVLFGDACSFYAALVDEGEIAPRFRPALALRDVEWWAYRTHDLDGTPQSGKDGGPGQVVGHATPGRNPWGLAAAPFACPDDLRTCWSAGRYVIRAVHPEHGEATLRVTVTSFLLFDFSSRRTADRYEASFRVGYANPDRRPGEVSLAAAVLDAEEGVRDRAGRSDLVREGDGLASAHPIRLSSEVPPREAEARALAEAPPRWPVLRAIPDARLRITVGDREYDFALPIEPGLLVLRNSSVPFGTEGTVLVPAKGRLRPVGGGPGNGNSGARADRPAPTDRPRSATRDEADRLLDIVSDAGRGRRLRVWLGEPVTFAARRRPRDLEDVFSPSDWLRNASWTLERIAMPSDRPPDAIVAGTSLLVVGRLRPRGLWGDPPTMFRLPEDVHGSFGPGRYVLRADARDGAWGSVRIDVAGFEIVDVKADLTTDRYEASVRFRLTDPFETRLRVPLEVRVISERDRVVDHVRGVTLVRDATRRGRYESDAVLLSTKVERPCQDRYERPGRDAAAAGPEILMVVPGSRLRVVLGDAVFTYPLPLSVYEILVGRARATDQPR